MYVERNIVAHWPNHCCRKITCYVCAFVLSPYLSAMQIGSFMRRIMLSFVACLALLYYAVICSLSGFIVLCCHL